MYKLEDYLDLNTPPYSLGTEKKNALYNSVIRSLTQHHYTACSAYHQILDKLNIETKELSDWTNTPFLPVRLFKNFDLRSTDSEKINKTMLSSGTSAQRQSKVYLDAYTSALQSKILTKIVSSFVGKNRLPMLVVDSPSVLKDRKMFSARGAGIIGFSLLAKKITYALDDDLNLQKETCERFFEEHKNQEFIVFGFTSMVWKHFMEAFDASHLRLKPSQGILIHGGGWKKLENEAVSPTEFKQRAANTLGISKVHNYYGMVEQTGSIFMECERGYLHSSIFSDVLVRDENLKLLGQKQAGLLELVSLLPASYPGHAILTEDIGEVVGVDDCECGRLGKYFQVHGRAKSAEVRGCSDVYS